MTDRSIGLDATRAPGPGGGEPDSTLRTGDTVGDYRIVRLLGRGGMGEVYEAENAVSRKRYAMKTLPRAAAAGRNFVERFRLEARVMSDLDHPHIVRVHHAGEANGIYYLTMDLVHGPAGEPRTLEDELAAGRIDPARVRTWALEICDALAYAHDHEVVHRDLKPSNVLLDPQGRAKVADFGLAKVVGTEYLRSVIQRSISLSMAGELSVGDEQTAAAARKPSSSARSILGTYDYMSPEQKAGGEVGPRADLYALGVMLYRMLTGRKPEGAWDVPSAFGVAKQWDGIVRRCLKSDPADRPASAAALGREIAKLRPGSSRAPRVLAFVLALAALAIGGSFAHREYQSRQARRAADEQQARIARANAVAQLQQAESKYRRAKALIECKAMTEDDFDSARRAYESALAIVRRNDGTAFAEGERSGIARKPLVAAEGGHSPVPVLPQRQSIALIEQPALRSGPTEGQDWTSPATDMEFVWIPALKIWVGKYEATNVEYRKKVPDHDSENYEGKTLNGDRQPVVQVSFDDAKSFAEWMTQRDRAAGALPADCRYRLPSEEEWQAFAQCGDGREFPWGSAMRPGYGNYGSGSGYDDGFTVTCPVERSGKNDWGLYGVGGNVWEAAASDSSGGSFGAWRVVVPQPSRHLALRLP